MGHYMTYSGLLVLVIALAGGRLLFDKRERIWSALVMPALLVALALTFTRGAWVGACAALGLLCVIKDLRLIGCTSWDEPIFPNLIGYIERGEVIPLVARTFALEDIATAQQEFLKKQHFGNFVLIPTQ